MSDRHSLRDSLLVRFSKPVFDRFIEAHPQVLMTMASAPPRSASAAMAASIEEISITHLPCLCGERN